MIRKEKAVKITKKAIKSGNKKELKQELKAVLWVIKDKAKEGYFRIYSCTINKETAEKIKKLGYEVRELGGYNQYSISWEE